jgi:polysaccharide biosynthesis/export protein
MMRMTSAAILALAAVVIGGARLDAAVDARWPSGRAATEAARPPQAAAAASTKPADQARQTAPTPPEAAKAGNQNPGQKPTAPKQAPPARAGATNQPAPVVPAPSVPPPPGYVIGPDDVLQVLFWRDKDISAEVVVRPDGMISLPLLNDVKAAGLTPDQLREAVSAAAAKFLEMDPSVTINIKAINSRKVFITGSVAKPGSYPLSAPTTVLQLISIAGGLTEFAKQKDISVMRTDNGKQLRFPFNYKDVAKGKNLKQNIELKPGDTVIVP